MHRPRPRRSVRQQPAVANVPSIIGFYFAGVVSDGSDCEPVALRVCEPITAVLACSSATPLLHNLHRQLVRNRASSVPHSISQNLTTSMPQARTNLSPSQSDWRAIVIHGAARAGDVFVIPECLAHLSRALISTPAKRLMFCQNQYYLAFTSDPRRGRSC
jgi:hypothetical protein